MSSEGQILLSALCAGIYIPFWYDIIRSFRVAIPHAKIVVGMEDLGYWIFVFLDIFAWMQEESNGSVRWFAVLGASFGMLLYKRVAKERIVCQLSRVLHFVFSIFCKLYNKISCPIAKIGTYSRKLAKQAKSTKLKYTRYIKNKLKYYFRLLTIKVRKR